MKHEMSMKAAIENEFNYPIQIELADNKIPDVLVSTRVPNIFKAGDGAFWKLLSIKPTVLGLIIPGLNDEDLHVVS